MVSVSMVDPTTDALPCTRRSCPELGALSGDDDPAEVVVPVPVGAVGEQSEAPPAPTRQMLDHITQTWPYTFQAGNWPLQPAECYTT